MKLFIFILFFLSGINLISQTDISRLSELQKIYFISETNSLTTNFVNPAALSMNKNDDGFLYSYDFFNTNNQGNSLASLSMGNLGFVYQDIYSFENSRLTSYALNLSVGGDLFSFGTSNKIINVTGLDNQTSYFTINAGFIFQPTEYFSLGFLASNINKLELDLFQYRRGYSVGAKIAIVRNVLNLFVQTDFKERKELSTNVSGSAGFSIQPINFLELRTWIMGNKNIIDEGILTAIFKLEGGFILSASAHFNDAREKTRYNAMLAIPLQTISF
ncbi:MAG: hypothetical protein KDC67_02305 [Ignavibacteriae bacterium]|nr:hypothetical protein [Ignavibacteriota bacterium]MCB0747498.1 hypothetical protein [Ignavibacteriota bacterium]